MLLGSSRPYPWLILEENGRWTDDDDDVDDERTIDYLGLDAEKPGLDLGLVGCGLGLVGFGLGLKGFGLEPRGLSRPTAETEQNVIGSKSVTNSQKSLMPLRIAS